MSVSIRPGRHAVHADAVRAEFARHRLGEAEHAGLGRRVMRAAEDAAAALRRDGRHAGDRALPSRPHVRNEGLAEVEDAAQVDVEDALPALRVDLHDLHRLGDAGIVDEDVDRPNSSMTCSAALPQRREVGDVAADADVAGAELGGGLGRASASSRGSRPGRRARRTAAPWRGRCRAGSPPLRSRRSCLEQHSFLLARSWYALAQRPNFAFKTQCLKSRRPAGQLQSFLAGRMRGGARSPGELVSAEFSLRTAKRTGNSSRVRNLARQRSTKCLKMYLNSHVES